MIARRPALRRSLPLAAALAAVAVLLAIVLTRIDLRTDMADLLPEGTTGAERFLLHEIRTGPATGVILLGVEGAAPDALARISRSMTGALVRSGLFEIVDNGGAEAFGTGAQDFLLHHRYLLAPNVTAQAFEVPALRQDFQRLFGLVQSSASPLVARYGLADPTGAFPAVLGAWKGTSRVRLLDGVWFAPYRDRALILAKMRGPGLDIDAEAEAGAAIDHAFSAADPGTARLLATGTALFSRDAARSIRHDIDLLSIASSVVVASLLFWRFRSVWVIAVIAIPVLLGMAAAALAVQLVFGFVHGIALGFGLTMLGVTVDYPVLLVGHRKQREEAPATLRRIGRAFTLAVLTAALGLTGMLFSAFPGLAQLGLFSVTGVLVAAAATRFLLPPLIVAADLAPVAAGTAERLLRIERLRAFRLPGAAVVAIAAIYLLARGGPHWERSLLALSPVPEAELALDQELRSEIGAPDSGQIGLVRGTSAEAVLESEEKLLPVLDKLDSEGAITGAEIAARLLPSEATQRARQAALPAPDELARRVAEAQTGLPFREDAFRPFIEDVGAARTMPPVTLADVSDEVARARLSVLLFQRGAEWFGVIAPVGVRDPLRVALALEAAGALYIDAGAAADAIVAIYTRGALRWLGIGAAVAAGVLFAGLRDPIRVLRVIAAIAAALLVTLTVLTLAGARLSLLSIVALQFVGGVGLDYALFFARRQLDEEERARTLRTLSICNAMTIATFCLLALCRTPLLSDIGKTVALGAAAALCFSFLFAGPRPGREPF